MGVVNILLIDDDEDDFILTRDFLLETAHPEEYRLSWCDNYSDGINAILKGNYDLFLVDYRLGSHSGLKLLDEAIKSNCTSPIIILTGRGDPSIDEESLKIGAADYLVKGQMNGETLSRSIRYALQHSKTLQNLMSSENKFRILFERSKEPILITDTEGQIYEANEAVLRLLDITYENLLRKNANDFYINSNDREKFTSAIEIYGGVKDLEVDILSESGQTKRCSISSFLQIDQHGNRALYYSILYDITHLKVGTRKKQLGENHEIAAVLAKNIFDPLSNIYFAAEELAISTRLPEEQDLLHLIKKNCDRINHSISLLIHKLDDRIDERS